MAVVALEQDTFRSKEKVDGVVHAMHSVTERFQQLSSHCNVVLVNDSLRDWHAAQEDSLEKPTTTLDINAVSKTDSVNLWL